MSDTPANLKIEKIPKQLIVDRIQAQLSQYDRAPFQKPLAMALANAPGHKHWRDMAKADPDKWARAVAQLAKTAGFAEVKENRNIGVDPEKLAKELTARFGHTKARELITAAGLPASLIPVITIDHDSQEVISDTA